MPGGLELDFLEGDFFLDDEIYINGIKEEAKDLLHYFGGVRKASELINCRYSRVKEWPMGRKPIPLGKLKELLNQCDKKFKAKIKTRILNKNILLKSRYSPHSITLPKKITPELAYVIGLILGDGFIAGKKANDNGNWTVAVYFDNFEHRELYSKAVRNLFGIQPKQGQDGSCYNCYFGSKAVHWFFRGFFSMETSPKADKIIIPSRIINCGKEEILVACIRGLFDSDGTITAQKRAKYASTSQKIVLQVASFLKENDFHPYVNEWLKSKKYKPLYTVTLNRKQDIIKFAQQISFIHPEKKRKLDEIVAKISPVV
ncbi:MAG: hypothetical protein NT067_01060 [Candidatus Diapherotrites archaeon]|nr:hypothetical protein [Candidatus Diapherotrites archaeon]